MIITEDAQTANEAYVINSSKDCGTERSGEAGVYDEAKRGNRKQTQWAWSNSSFDWMDLHSFSNPSE